MILEARLTRGLILKQIFECIKDFMSEVQIHFTQQGLSIQCMDSTHVSLVDVTLNRSAFDLFSLKTPLCLGVGAQVLYKALCALNIDDALTIMQVEEGGDVLTLILESRPPKQIIAEDYFEIKLVHVFHEPLRISPSTCFKCRVQMPSTEFQRIVSDSQVIGDTCLISCTDRGIRFRTASQHIQRSILVRANSTEVVISMKEPVELNFSLRYLKDVTNATPLSSIVHISMSPNVPAVIEYRIQDCGSVRYLVAPISYS
jgi:proliferating cell nuclear antigen